MENTLTDLTDKTNICTITCQTVFKNAVNSVDDGRWTLKTHTTQNNTSGH